MNSNHIWGHVEISDGNLSRTVLGKIVSFFLSSVPAEHICCCHHGSREWPSLGVGACNADQPQPTLRSTHYSCIFMVTTIVRANAPMGAVSQACLTPSAEHVIIVDGTTALTKGSKWKCRRGSGVTKLTTHHTGVSYVPSVITHSAPYSVVVDFYTTLTVSGTSHQSDFALCVLQRSNNRENTKCIILHDNKLYQWTTLKLLYNHTIISD